MSLPLCVMHGLSRLITPHSAEAIAEAINSLRPEEINGYKKAALIAADKLP